jgi:hypothetical protein
MMQAMNDRWRVCNDSETGSVYIEIFESGDLYEMSVGGSVASKIGSVKGVHPYCGTGREFIGFPGTTSTSVFTYSAPSAPQLRE